MPLSSFLCLYMISRNQYPFYVESLSMYLPAFSQTSHVTRCVLTDSHHSPPSPSTDSPAVPFRTCTPHDPPSLRYSVDDILQIILKSRKSWKTLKGQSEAVWPPHLEATMLKGMFIIVCISRFSRLSLSGPQLCRNMNQMTRGKHEC